MSTSFFFINYWKLACFFLTFEILLSWLEELILPTRLLALIIQFSSFQWSLLLKGFGNLLTELETPSCWISSASIEYLGETGDLKRYGWLKEDAHQTRKERSFIAVRKQSQFYWLLKWKYSQQMYLPVLDNGIDEPMPEIEIKWR